MEKKSLSLLAKIKSKYILQEVLCLAYTEIKLSFEEVTLT